MIELFYAMFPFLQRCLLYESPSWCFWFSCFYDIWAELLPFNHAFHISLAQVTFSCPSLFRFALCPSVFLGHFWAFYHCPTSLCLSWVVRLRRSKLVSNFLSLEIISRQLFHIFRVGVIHLDPFFWDRRWANWLKYYFTSRKIFQVP